jgi:alpha,alpha-trehalase
MCCVCCGHSRHIAAAAVVTAAVTAVAATAAAATAAAATSGIATTLYHTGQQWDWPNGWPPLQHMLVEGARNFGGNPGQDFACSLARTWLE